MSRAWSLGLATMVAVMGAGTAALDAAATLLAAHRGGAALRAENSLAAFRNAVALGADYLEFDVHLSSDGEVVVIHDPTLDRTTSGRGPVRLLPLAELRALRLKDRTGALTEDTVPTLDEVAALAASAHRRMLLEIKVDERRQRYPGIEEKVLAILDRHAMAGATIVMAFEPETWRRVRQLRPEVTAGALYSPRMLTASASTALREVEAANRAGVGFVGLHQDLIDADVAAAARRLGLRLGVWTVNEPDAMRRVIDLRADVLITDRPDVAKALLGR